MGWCKLGSTAGPEAVHDLLMFNTSLRSLDVRGNGFENNGAIWLSRALKEHTNERLQELDLGYNEIKDEGACQIAQVRLLVQKIVRARRVSQRRAGGQVALQV